MRRDDHIDPEMRELMDLLVKAIVPSSRRKAVYRVNKHSPYYSDGRWRRL